MNQDQQERAEYKEAQHKVAQHLHRTAVSIIEVGGRCVHVGRNVKEGKKKLKWRGSQKGRYIIPLVLPVPERKGEAH